MVFLCVDDSVTMRKIVSLAIKELGEVIEASSGEEALRVLDKQPRVDAFILDVNMPGMNGVELVRTLRAKPAYASTPIVMLTTESEKDRIEEGMKAGASAWLVKPFEKDVLLAKIRELLGVP